MKNKSQILLNTIMMALTVNLTISNACAQDATKEDVENLSTEVEEVAKGLEKLTKMLEELKENEDKQEVGWMKLKGEKVKIYTKENSQGTDTKIDRVSIRWHEGFIRTIEIDAGGNKYFNKKAPIALTTKRIENCDALYSNTNSEHYIRLCDLFEYNIKSTFAPDDGKHSFTSINDTLNFSKSAGLNDMLNVRLYTDFLSTFGNEPNALTQTEINYRHNTGKTNVKNCGIIVFKHFSADLRLSKFDNDFKYMDIDSFSDRTNLLRFQFYDLMVRQNIIEGWISRGSESSYYLNAGLGLAGTKSRKIIDTLTVDTVTVHTPYLMAEIGFHFKPAENWDMYLSLPMFYVYAPNLQDFGLQDPKWALRPQFDLSYYPFKNKGNRMFTRVVYNINEGEHQRNFAQWQIGYSASFTDFGK